jgi:hypothetical protein
MSQPYLRGRVIKPACWELAGLINHLLGTGGFDNPPSRKRHRLNKNAYITLKKPDF